MSAPIQVLFVCLGNICRSPAAEAVFGEWLKHRDLVDKIQLDSAATADYHMGRPANIRMIRAAEARNIDMSTLRSRQVTKSDFNRFDWIVAMDHSNLTDLQAMQPVNSCAHLCLMLDYPAAPQVQVPDPYYGEDSDFGHVLDLLQQACEPLYNRLVEDSRLA